MYKNEKDKITTVRGKGILVSWAKVPPRFFQKLDWLKQESMQIPDKRSIHFQQVNNTFELSQDHFNYILRRNKITQIEASNQDLTDEDMAQIGTP